MPLPVPPDERSLASPRPTEREDRAIELLINMVLLTLLALVTIGIVRVRNLFAVVVLSSAYSFLIASVMIVLDAVDVAMTEASVGAGISTVLVLGALYLTQDRGGAAAPLDGDPAGRRLRHGRDADLRLVRAAGLRHGRPAGQQRCRRRLSRAEHARHRDPERRHRRAGELSRLSTRWARRRVIFCAGIGVLLLLRRWRTEGPR